MAVTWQETKTNWTVNDAFNAADFNRIRNNINYIAENMNTPSSLEDMGSAVASGDTTPWDRNYFNAIEANLELLASKLNNVNIGARKYFYANGAFITADELNRIETGLDTLKATQEYIYTNVRRIPFKLGRYRAIRA